MDDLSFHHPPSGLCSKMYIWGMYVYVCELIGKALEIFPTLTHVVKQPRPREAKHLLLVLPLILYQWPLEAHVS